VILSDEEIEQCAVTSRGDSHAGCATRFAKAIEAAVISKMYGKEPVAFINKRVVDWLTSNDRSDRAFVETVLSKSPEETDVAIYVLQMSKE